MSEKEMIDKYDALLVLGLVIFTLISPNIFGEYNTIVNLGLGAFCWFAFYTNNRKKFIHEIIIIRMLILSIPLSFRDIFGNPYGASIISWFNIFLLIILITYLIKYHFTVKHIFSNFLSLLSLLLIIIGLIPILGVRDYYDAIKQYINIVVPFGLIIIGNSLKDNINDNNIELELDKNHAFFNSDCRCWKYKNGELIFDKEKQLKLIDEFKNIEEKPTTQERIEALENALLELILRGDDDD